jgi:hypothetical protein
MRANNNGEGTMLIAIPHHGLPWEIHGDAKVVIIGKIHVWILVTA